jgi:tetratricopeptide (TPR) repeat protein
MRRITGILVLVLAAAVPRSARAAEDAGTQSAFAFGAGSRALGMGGAYVASANDASALFWNPAGLGWAERAELQFAQSGNLAFGATESYAALLIPSWRFGAFGLTVRHFGIGEVEARDDRNVATGAMVSDAETEMALGYGRRLGSWWTVGGTARLQRQSLAGFSGSAMGLDLGLAVVPFRAMGLETQWADAWTWAMSVRNAVEPAIRLDLEKVPDPTALRTGLAYRRSLWGLDQLVAEIDLEKPRGTGVITRAGIEYAFRGTAAMRVGMNGSHMSAGTSLRWRELSLDYVYQDGALETAHRFGLSLPFGSTVSDARDGAIRAEDQALEQRLAEAFQQRQHERLQELFVEAGDHFRASRFEEALAAIPVIRTLDPQFQGLAELEAGAALGRARALERSGEFAAAALAYDAAATLAPEAAEALAGAVRCRDQSDRLARRNDALRQRFAMGMDALVREDYPSARSHLQAVLDQDSQDREAQQMLRLVESALQKETLRQVEHIERLIASRDLAGAETQLEQLHRAAPTLVDMGRLRASITRARTSEAARKPAVTAAAPASRISSMPDREVEELYRRGLEALRQGRSEEAVRFWELVWSNRPGHRQVADLLKREYLTRGMESFAAGRLEDALTQWNRVLEIDPADVRAGGYIERARRQMNRSREILGGTR